MWKLNFTAELMCGHFRDPETFQMQFYANFVGCHNFGQWTANSGPIVGQPPTVPTEASQVELFDKWTNTLSQLL
jgi:hypothetical protein